MHFPEARVSDLLRIAQRDDVFINEMQPNIQAIFKLFGAPNSHTLRKLIPNLTNIWYYLMTSASGLQTLGEEYTGTVRLDSDNKIPGKILQIFWLSFYLGGEAMFDRLIAHLEKKIWSNSELTNEARSILGGILNFASNNKLTLRRIHHSLFYIDGKYYNISNRITGIKYALVRKWMEDDSFTASFRILGYLSLFYILLNTVQQIFSQSGSNTKNKEIVTSSQTSQKGCVLCTENRKNACATPCGHVFCWDCISDSLNYQQNCPICREVVLPSRIIYLQNY